MNLEYLEEGDDVEESPVGPGKITGFSERGFPQVNHVTVARLKRTDGIIFDPYRSYDAEKRKAEQVAEDMFKNKDPSEEHF